ncbi:MAG: hypothetical protein ACRDTH_19820 [Pseudonocardiaceae bacterium]
MSRPARWAFSPLDYPAHLLLCDGDHPRVCSRRDAGTCCRLLPPCMITRRAGRAHIAH